MERITKYLNEILGNSRYEDIDDIQRLINSHKRQREIIQEYGTERRRALGRLKFLPRKIKLWILGA